MTYDTEYYKFDPTYHRIASFLGLDVYQRQDFETAKKVSLIYEWAQKNAKSNKFETQMRVIKDLQKGLGINVIGRELTNRLWESIRLGLDRAREAKIKERREAELERERTKAQEIAKSVKETVKETVKSQIDKYIKKQEVKKEVKKEEPKEEPKQEEPVYYNDYTYGIRQPTDTYQY